MRILLLVHSFNSLAQRLHVELSRDGHELSVEFDIHDRVTEEAVALFQPELVIAPFLKRAIPESVWRRHRCLVVHPGPPGDRGPSALDWAILRGSTFWGVTVLQADAEMDAGAVWASQLFPMRAATKSSLYRHEVAHSAVSAVRAAIARIVAGASPVSPDNRTSEGEPGWQPAMKQTDRLIDWVVDDSATVLRKLHSADGSPGIEDVLFGQRVRMFDGRLAEGVFGCPGEIVGCNDEAICRATTDGAVWIGQLQPVGSNARGFKRPAMRALGPLASQLPRLNQRRTDGRDNHDREIRYHESGRVGYLSFDLYNGALSTGQCQRLRASFAYARERPTRVVVLTGGPDFWCNGMHLHCIEAADSPAEESWANINAIDDLAHDILTTETHLTVAALRGNVAAGGVFLALATDRVMARSTVVLNAHYRNMGNLFGSEYWTYLLPRRVGAQRASDIMASRLPLGAAEAMTLGLIDDVASIDAEGFVALVRTTAQTMAEARDFQYQLDSKRACRARDEQVRALSSYRDDELRRMQLNFFGFDPSYHIARHRFVHRDPLSWTPLHLARHRRSDFVSNAVAST